MSGVRLHTFETTADGRHYTRADDNAEGDVWQIAYPGQVYSSSTLDLRKGHMNKYTAETIASAMARVFEAGRQQAFRDIRALIGAK